MGHDAFSTASKCNVTALISAIICHHMNNRSGLLARCTRGDGCGCLMKWVFLVVFCSILELVAQPCHHTLFKWFHQYHVTQCGEHRSQNVFVFPDYPHIRITSLLYCTEALYPQQAPCICMDEQNSTIHQSMGSLLDKLHCTGNCDIDPAIYWQINKHVQLPKFQTSLVQLCPSVRLN